MREYTREPLAARILYAIFLIIGLLFLAASAAVWLLLPPWEEARPIMGSIYGAIGAVFTVIGGVVVGLRRSAARKKRRLLESGERIMARVVNVERNFGIRVNGRCPWRLICEYREGGVAYQYRSDNIWVYPSLTGELVPVYRDRQDPRRYYVDAGAVILPTVEL